MPSARATFSIDQSCGRRFGGIAIEICCSKERNGSLIVPEWLCWIEDGETAVICFTTICVVKCSGFSVSRGRLESLLMMTTPAAPVVNIKARFHSPAILMLQICHSAGLSARTPYRGAEATRGSDFCRRRLLLSA